jgi:hypothetical protein
MINPTVCLLFISDLQTGSQFRHMASAMTGLGCNETNPKSNYRDQMDMGMGTSSRNHHPDPKHSTSGAQEQFFGKYIQWANRHHPDQSTDFCFRNDQVWPKTIGRISRNARQRSSSLLWQDITGNNSENKGIAGVFKMRYQGFKMDLPPGVLTTASPIFYRATTSTGLLTDIFPI